MTIYASELSLSLSLLNSDTFRLSGLVDLHCIAIRRCANTTESVPELGSSVFVSQTPHLFPWQSVRRGRGRGQS